MEWVVAAFASLPNWKRMLKVLLTIDTELWPRGGLTDASFADAMARDVFGRTARGEFGLRYQIDRLNAMGLQAVFFVEALFASMVGLDPLREIVQVIRESGHDLQLHIHPEWLAKKPDTILPGRSGQHLTEFTQGEQQELIRRGMDNLRACGVETVCAFRAGSFGANFATLDALRANGITFDSSYNPTYFGDSCGLEAGTLLQQPQRLQNVWEVPVSFVQEPSGRFRHAQLAACSSGEMEAAMLQARSRGWPTFVIVLHSFELLRWRPGRGHVACPDRIMVRRFDRLCRFLADNRDKFRTTTFRELDCQTIPAERDQEPLRTSRWRASWRMAEQIARRYVA